MGAFARADFQAFWAESGFWTVRSGKQCAAGRDTLVEVVEIWIAP